VQHLPFVYNVHVLWNLFQTNTSILCINHLKCVKFSAFQYTPEGNHAYISYVMPVFWPLVEIRPSYAIARYVMYHFFMKFVNIIFYHIYLNDRIYHVWFKLNQSYFWPCRKYQNYNKCSNKHTKGCTLGIWQFHCYIL